MVTAYEQVFAQPCLRASRGWDRAGRTLGTVRCPESGPPSGVCRERKSLGIRPGSPHALKHIWMFVSPCWTPRLEPQSFLGPLGGASSLGSLLDLTSPDLRVRGKHTPTHSQHPVGSWALRLAGVCVLVHGMRQMPAWSWWRVRTHFQTALPVLAVFRLVDTVMA